jgi:hypothetical protein
MTGVAVVALSPPKSGGEVGRLRSRRTGEGFSAPIGGEPAKPNPRYARSPLRAEPLTWPDAARPLDRSSLRGARATGGRAS